MSDAPLIVTPQAYPLTCTDQNDQRWFIVGWTSSGTPVGVPHGGAVSWGRSTSDAQEISGKLIYATPADSLPADVAVRP